MRKDENDFIRDVIDLSNRCPKLKQDFSSATQTTGNIFKAYEDFSKILFLQNNSLNLYLNYKKLEKYKNDEDYDVEYIQSLYDDAIMYYNKLKDYVLERELVNWE